MNKIKYLFKKLKEHYDDLGFWKTTKWLFFAVRFRTLAFITKGKSIIQGEGNIRERKKYDGLIKKDGRKIFIFASIPYYDIGGGQRSAQLAKVFNNLGYEVFYIFGAHSSESIIYNMEIPTVRHLYVDNYKEENFRDHVKKEDLVIVEFPHEKFLPFLDIAKNKKAKIVYENIDNWETSLGSDLFKKDVLFKFLKKADVLVGTAKPLVKQLKGYLRELKISKNVIYVPNAVNESIFDSKKDYKKPNDFIAGEKTLLYYGSLWGEWFDWELIFGIAKKFPSYSILMIGEDKCIKSIVEKAPKNVHFLGIKRQTELPAYLKYSDVAMIPFKVDKIGEYVSPLKIFEYISMGKNVISTKLPEVIGYPNTFVGDTIDEWENILLEIATKEPEDPYVFINNNTWYSRSEKILESVYREEKKCDSKYYNNISIVILNYNNKQCIFDCVDSLLFFNNRYKYSIIVVDNGSTDGSYELLQDKYDDKIILLKNIKNGCSSGRNLGIRSIKTDYVLFLDSDQFALHNSWLDNFIKLGRKYGDYGAIGWSGGWLKVPKRKMSSIVDDYPYRYVPADIWARLDLDYLGSGGMLIKKEILDKIDGFDEQFDPTCFEDTDLSLAIKNEGLELFYCPYLGIRHVPHQTTRSGSAGHTKLLKEHEQKFVTKWKIKNKDLLKNK